VPVGATITPPVVGAFPLGTFPLTAPVPLIGQLWLTDDLDPAVRNILMDDPLAFNVGNVPWKLTFSSSLGLVESFHLSHEAPAAVALYRAQMNVLGDPDSWVDLERDFGTLNQFPTVVL
jgi:hypothetical protein